MELNTAVQYNKIAYQYIVEHIYDAPWYKIWEEHFWIEIDDKVWAFIKEVEDMEVEEKEKWLMQFAVYWVTSRIKEELSTENVTRVEVIDENWRAYTNYNAKSVLACLQDNKRTLKVFLNWNKKPND